MTAVTLGDFQRFLSSNPWHFFGLSGTGIPQSACDEVVPEHSWQEANRISRDDIRQALEKAEELFVSEHGPHFAPAPHFVTEELRYPRYFDHTLWRANNADATSHWASAQVSENYVQKLGVETLTLLGTVNVTLSDSDSDGVTDTFVTAPLATALTGNQVDQVEVYFSAADRLDSDDANERWRIGPVTVTISGGNINVRGRSWLLVKPPKKEGVNALTLDVQTAANYVTTVDLYRHYADPTGITQDTVQAFLKWETRPWPHWQCCLSTALTFQDNSLDPSAVAYALARAGIRDNGQLGHVYLGQAVYDPDASAWAAVAWGDCRPPDTVTVRYQAGYPLQNGVYSGTTLKQGVVAPKWVKIVCALACAELTKPIDACTQAQRTLYYWQFDLARTSGSNDESYGLTTREILNCPFGTRRGHVYAWSEFKREYVARAIRI